MHSLLVRDTIQMFANSRYPDMEESTKAKLEKLLVPAEYKKGEIICKQGTPVKDIFLVGKGMIRQYYVKDEKEITEHFSYEGCVFMFIESMLRDETNYLTAEALEPTILFRISYEKLLEATHSDWGLNVMYRRILEHSLVVSQKKAYTTRFNTAKERYNTVLKEHPEVVKRAPLNYIASYINMTPETLSRVRSGVL